MGLTTTIELDGQYRALREGAGQLERDRAKLSIEGSDGASYLQSQLTNEIESLAPGSGCYAALLDRKGRMQGDMRVLRLASERVWIDLEEEARAAVVRHLETYKIGRQVEIADRSDACALISLIGPAAESMVGGPLGAEHSHRELALGGVTCRAVAAHEGIDLICATADAPALAAALAEAGAVEVHEEAAEIVRVESGRPRFGREMGPQTIPQEAGINDRAVSFTKGCYIGQETVARLHYKGKPNRHLRGLRLRAAASAGDPIALEDREVGRVGTAALSPALGPLALAIVRREAEPGVTVAVGDGNGAEVVELPF